LKAVHIKFAFLITRYKQSMHVLFIAMNLAAFTMPLAGLMSSLKLSNN